MSGRHTGQYLARELESLLKAFGIEKKVWLFYLHRNPMTPHTEQDSHGCM
jgi:hypothetical protein